MSTTPKLILLTHFFEKHGLPRKGHKCALKWCKEVGIEIVQVMQMTKGVSIIVQEEQAAAALKAWQEKPTKEPQGPATENTRIDRLEDRMIGQEQAIEILIQAQNVVAKRLKQLLEQLGVKVEEKEGAPDAA